MKRLLLTRIAANPDIEPPRRMFVRLDGNEFQTRNGPIQLCVREDDDLESLAPWFVPDSETIH